MTIEVGPVRRETAGDGIIVAFEFDWRIYTKNDIAVYKVDTTTRVATLQVIDTDYAVAINGEDNTTTTDGGIVTYVVAPTASQSSLIIAGYALNQLTALAEVGNIGSDDIETLSDRLSLVTKMLAEELDRSFKVTVASNVTDLIIPQPSGNAIYIKWKLDGSALEVGTLIGSGTISIPVDVIDGGTGGITGTMSLVQGANREISIGEKTVGAGDTFTLAAGAAQSLGTDLAGGTAIVSAGASQGNGSSAIQLKAAKAGVSGSTTSSPTLALEIIAQGAKLHPHGISAGNTGEMRYLELAANGTNSIGFKSPDALAADLDFVYPSVDAVGSLNSDGSGVLSFAPRTQHTNATATLAEIIADKTLVAGVAGKSIHISAVYIEVTGTFTTATDVRLQSTDASPIVALTYAIAGLAGGAILAPTSTNVTMGVGIVQALEVGEGIEVITTGAALAGGTSIEFNITYTVE